MFICLCWVKHHVPSAHQMLRVFPLESHSWLFTPLWVLANDGVCLHHCYRSRSWKRPHYWCQAPKKAEWEKCSRKGWCHTVAHPRMSDSLYRLCEHLQYRPSPAWIYLHCIQHPDLIVIFYRQIIQSPEVGVCLWACWRSLGGLISSSRKLQFHFSINNFFL